MSAVDLAITNKTELNAHIDELVNSFKNYVNIRDAVTHVEKGKVLQVDGKTVDNTYLKNAGESFEKALRNLSKAVVPKKVKSESARAKTKNSGFDNPVYVNKYIVKFFTERADILGLDPKTKQALNALLPCLVKHQLTTSSILTTLWTIYTNVQKDKITVVEVKADPKTGKPK